MNSMKLKRLFIANALLLGAGLMANAQAETTSPDNAALIKQGEYVARLGDCGACHTVAGKPAFSGGLAINSNLGTIYSTNITPDKNHGIGNYTEQPPETDLSFPFSQRWGMRFWNWAFASDKPFQPIGGATAQVNRGAYLVESLGHCGSCHTPRGFGMNEKALDSSDSDFLAGGSLNNWDVPSLRGVAHWNQQEIVDYLGKGRNDKAAVGGEMTSVVENSTAHMTDDDLNAIAAYLKFLGGNPPVPAADTQKASATEAKLTAAKNLSEGERLYLDNCGACHFVTGKGAPGVFPQLDQATIVNAQDPTGLIHTILAGAQQPSTARAPSTLVMPGFAARLSDEEAAQLATFIRQGWSNNAPAVSAKDVSEVRKTLAH